jgi:hypothetical protein
VKHCECAKLIIHVFWLFVHIVPIVSPDNQEFTVTDKFPVLYRFWKFITLFRKGCPLDPVLNQFSLVVYIFTSYCSNICFAIILPSSYLLYAISTYSKRHTCPANWNLLYSTSRTVSKYIILVYIFILQCKMLLTVECYF